MVTLLDSSLKGGAPEVRGNPKRRRPLRPARGNPGYQAAIRKRVLVDAKTKESKERLIAGPKIEEYVGDQIVIGHGQPTGALKLPIEETPEVPWGDIQKDWVNVKTFEERKAEDDWAPAIQAAIDSGAKTIYFPTGRYEVASPIHLRGKIERLFGLHSRSPGRRMLPADQPALIFDEPDGSAPSAIERLEIDGLRHESPATLVLKSSGTGRYTNARGCGKIFMEDIGSADFHFDHPQQVWVRQWNPESHDDGPCILSHGATIWCLGFKTEYESSKLWAEAGAQTEILGAFIYPWARSPRIGRSSKTPTQRCRVIYGTSVYQDDHKIHILDAKAGNVKVIGNDQLQSVGSRARMDLYYQRGAAP